jgi:hypothetical protein
MNANLSEIPVSSFPAPNLALDYLVDRNEDKDRWRVPRQMGFLIDAEYAGHMINRSSK